MMQITNLLDRALALDALSIDEGAFLFTHAPTAQLMFVGNELRKIHKKDTLGIVTWQIDRNVNTTNVCVANCKFCNFFVPPGSKKSFKWPQN